MGAADPSPAFQSKAELQTWLTYYHREPRRSSSWPRWSPSKTSCAARIHAGAQAGRGGMTLVLRALAGQDRMPWSRSKASLRPRHASFVAEALWRCGTKLCASALGALGRAAGRRPDIRAAPVDSRSAIDDLWASYSATGDPAYVEAGQ